MSDSTTRHKTQSALNLTLQGIAGSPGISIGKAYLVEQESVEVVEKRFVEDKDISSEVKRFKAAVKKAQKPGVQGSCLYPRRSYDALEGQND